jgi:formylglycine-generating enzyme required for sulfatase activity
MHGNVFEWVRDCDESYLKHAYPYSSGGFLCDMRTNPELEHDAAEPQRLVA